MAVEIDVKISNIKQIKAAFRRSPAVMTKELNTAIRKTVLVIRGRSVRNAPARTGRLRSSAYTSYAPLMGEIGFKANYALFVHEGTKAHMILPLTKKALWWKGANHPVARVRHPGTRANPFLKRAVTESQGDVDRYFKEAVDNTMQNIAKESG